METTKFKIANRKTQEWMVTILFIGLIVLTAATYYLNLNKSNWLSGPILLIMEFFAIGLQSLSTYIVWKSNNKKIKTLLTIISILILTFIILGFFNFITKCS